MEALSLTEVRVANEYCKGLSDKEVAANLSRSIWTTKTQKKSIYRKIGINKDTELLLYMICEKLKVNFDLKEIRKHGIELMFCVLFLVIQITNHDLDMRKSGRLARARTSVRSGRTRGSSNDFNWDAA